MAILRLEELEAYIKFIYKKHPETQYSLKKLKDCLKSYNVNNNNEDVSLLHLQLYDPAPYFSEDDDGYSMNNDFPVLPEDLLEDDIMSMRRLEVSSENTALIGKLYGDGLDEFYNDERFR